MADWLVEDDMALAELSRSAMVGAERAEGEAAKPLDSPIAVLLHDLLILDNKKWFNFLGGADIRVDMLVVQGNVLEENPRSFYTPTTVRFPDVGNHETLPIDEHGLLAYYGWPKHFLDMSVMISRDTKGSDDLVTLLERELTGSEFANAASTLMQLALAGPTALVVRGAIGAAAQLGALAYRVVRAICGTTIGVYRGNRLEYPQRFGLGRNPAEGTYEREKLAFWYEVAEAGPATETGERS
jgi:hypothetical protein